MASLADELRLTKRRMQKAEDQVEHMKIECQLRCCSCRLAERKGASFGHDIGIQDAVSKKMGEMEEALVDEVTESMKRLSMPGETKDSNRNGTTMEVQPTVEETPQQRPQDEREPEVTFCRDTGTFQLISPTKGTSAAPASDSCKTEEPQEADFVMVNGHESPPAAQASPVRPMTTVSSKDEASATSTAPPMTPAPAQPIPPSQDPPVPSSTQNVLPPTEPALSPVQDISPRQTPASPILPIDESSPAQSPTPPTPLPHHQHHHQNRRPLLRTITTTTTIPLAGGCESPLKSPVARPTTTVPITTTSNAPPKPNQNPPFSSYSSSTEANKTDAHPTTTEEASQSKKQGNETHHMEMKMTMTREQALEQIRLRRGRARSIAANTLTPRKQMVEGGVGIKRDISAPAMRG